MKLSYLSILSIGLTLFSISNLGSNYFPVPPCSMALSKLSGGTRARTGNVGSRIATIHANEPSLDTLLQFISASDEPAQIYALAQKVLPAARNPEEFTQVAAAAISKLPFDQAYPLYQIYISGARLIEREQALELFSQVGGRVRTMADYDTLQETVGGGFKNLRVSAISGLLKNPTINRSDLAAVFKGFKNKADVIKLIYEIPERALDFSALARNLIQFDHNDIQSIHAAALKAEQGSPVKVTTNSELIRPKGAKPGANSQLEVPGSLDGKLENDARFRVVSLGGPKDSPLYVSIGQFEAAKRFRNSIDIFNSDGVLVSKILVPPTIDKSDASLRSYLQGTLSDFKQTSIPKQTEQVFGFDGNLKDGKVSDQSAETTPLNLDISIHSAGDVAAERELIERQLWALHQTEEGIGGLITSMDSNFGSLKEIWKAATSRGVAKYDSLQKPSPNGRDADGTALRTPGELSDEKYLKHFFAGPVRSAMNGKSIVFEDGQYKIISDQTKPKVALISQPEPNRFVDTLRKAGRKVLGFFGFKAKQPSNSDLRRKDTARIPIPFFAVGDSIADFELFLGKVIGHNPGALQVVHQIRKSHGLDILSTLHKLDAMGLRGERLWAAYQDFAHQDLNVLLTAVLSSDPKLIEVVDRSMGGK